MEVRPIKIKEGMKISELIESFSFSAFNARRLGESAKLWRRMIEEKAFIFLTLAGAMIPAGMREIVKDLLEKEFVNSLVLTGANLVHEICEALGFKHELGDANASDVELAEGDVNRIYDVFISTSSFMAVEELLATLFKDLEGNRSSRELVWLIGSKLENSFLRTAFDKKIPVFCPTFHDSIAGLHLALYGKKVVLDYRKDISEILDLCSQKRKVGIVIVGGGVPKNFALQAMLLSNGFDYAIQITTDSPQFGGLSGATLEEAKSWCKLKKDAKTVTVYCDATIALPLICSYLVDNKL
ncbi:MAG: deoxyhypusine synthase [Archaeoglobaceae archaeon]